MVHSVLEDDVNLLFEAAADIGWFFGERGWRYCVIGGLALQRWGEPRTTQDVDISLLTGIGDEERFVRDILARFAPRIHAAREFALRNRVLLVTTTSGVDIDISLAALPFEEEMTARAVEFEFFPGLVLPMCTAEDLVVMKAFAGRPRDWLDIEGIVKRQGSRLDAAYVLRHLELLCELKEDAATVPRVEKLLGMK